jgi:hypothetical protein
MSERSFRHHPATLVIASCALFVSLGGTGYAVAELPRHSVGPAQLKKGAVTSKTVANGSLKTRDFGAGQLPQGPTGPAGPSGAPGGQGATGPSNVYVRDTGGSSVAITGVFGSGVNTLVRSMALPAGSYYITAFVFADNNSSTLLAEPRCSLHTTGTTVAAGSGGVFVPIAPHTGTNSYRALFQLDSAITLSGAGTVTVECNKNTAAQLVNVGASLTAIQTGSITSVP